MSNVSICLRPAKIGMKSISVCSKIMQYLDKFRSSTLTCSYRTFVMIYDGFWFYTNVFELKRKSIFEFEKKFVHLYIKHILFVIGYLQTNDNLKQLHEEI